MTLGARLIILILLAADSDFSDYEIREGRIAAVLQSAEMLAGLVAARQDRVVEGARLLLEATSHLQSIQEKNAESCNQRLRHIAGKVQELTAMAVLTPEGERWCVSLTGTGPINLADREYFQETIRTRSMQSSDYIVGRQTGQGSLVFTYPAFGDSDSIESVVFVAYRTSVLSRMLNEPQLPEARSSRFWIVPGSLPPDGRTPTNGSANLGPISRVEQSSNGAVRRVAMLTGAEAENMRLPSLRCRHRPS